MGRVSCGPNWHGPSWFWAELSVIPRSALRHGVQLNTSIKERVAQCLAHLPLVLEVPGSVPARGEENFGVQTHFL